MLTGADSFEDKRKVVAALARRFSQAWWEPCQQDKYCCLYSIKREISSN